MHPYTTSTTDTTQCARILAALRCRPHTSYELRKLGCYQANTRVLELRRMGYDIRTKRVSILDDEGYRHDGIALYVLYESGNLMPLPDGFRQSGGMGVAPPRPPDQSMAYREAHLMANSDSTASVLTHPKFDRPKVENPRHRGRYVGNVSRLRPPCSLTWAEREAQWEEERMLRRWAKERRYNEYASVADLRRLKAEDEAGARIAAGPHADLWDRLNTAQASYHDIWTEIYHLKSEMRERLGKAMDGA